jgi:hypothetical protein
VLWQTAHGASWRRSRLSVWASSGTSNRVNCRVTCYSWGLLPPRLLKAAEEHWHELVIVHGHLLEICEGLLIFA